MQGLNGIMGRLHMEVWADEQLASEKRIGRQLRVWAERQETAGREKGTGRVKAGSSSETLEGDSPEWIP